MPMKTFIATSVLALTLTSTANAQPSSPKRLRAGRGNKGSENLEQHRQTVVGDDHIRNLGSESMPTQMSMEYIALTETPVEPSTSTEGPCEALNKKQCAKDDSCSWDGSECFPTAILEQPVQPLSMPSEAIGFQMSMPVDMIVDTSQPVDPCEDLNKKQCRRDDLCTWDRSECFTTLDVARRKRDVTRDVQPMSMSLVPADFQMSMPVDMIVDTTQPVEVCKELNKKQCRRDDLCTWNGSECFTTTAALDIVRSKRDVALGMQPMSMSLEPGDIQMSMPVAVAKPTGTEEPCEVLTKKKCRKQESCIWDDPICYTAPTENVMPLGLSEFQMSLPVDMMVAPTESTTTTTTATTIEDPCARLRRKKCKGTCTWDDNAKCHTAPSDGPREKDNFMRRQAEQFTQPMSMPLELLEMSMPIETMVTPPEEDEESDTHEEDEEGGLYIVKELYSVEQANAMRNSASSLFAPTVTLALVCAMSYLSK